MHKTERLRLLVLGHSVANDSGEKDSGEDDDEGHHGICAQMSGRVRSAELPLSRTPVGSKQKLLSREKEYCVYFLVTTKFDNPYKAFLIYLYISISLYTRVRDPTKFDNPYKASPRYLISNIHYTSPIIIYNTRV